MCLYKSLSNAASIKAEVEVVKCGAHENVLKMEMGYVHKRYEWVQDSVTNRIRGKPMLTGTNLGRTVPR